MRKNFTAVDYVSFALLGCVVVVWVLYIAFGWGKLGAFLADQATAAWVQAFGSIGAILATGWAVHRAHKLQLHQRSLEEEAGYTIFLEFAYQLVGGARDVVRKIVDSERSGQSGRNARRAMLAELGAFSDAFGQLDLSRLHGFAVIRAVLAGDAITKMVIADIELTFNPNFSNMMEMGFLLQAAENSLSMLEEHAETLAIALRDRRGVARSETLTL